jgi:hypothetical protein
VGGFPRIHEEGEQPEGGALTDLTEPLTEPFVQPAS